MKTKLLLMFLFLTITLQAQTNLVPNGNFENWTSSSQPNNWFRFFNGLVFQSTSAQNGSSSTKMQITSGTFNYINSEFFPVVAGKTYRITMYHKLVTGTFSAIDLRLYHQPGTFKTEITKKTDAVTSSTEWRKIEFDYTPTVSESIEVDIWTTGTLNSEILVDNVSVVDVATLGPQYTLIPDLNFEKFIISLGYDSGTPDGKVLTSNIASVTSLNVNIQNIADLTGIQDFISLKSLTCAGNSWSVDGGNGLLTKLDVTKNVALTSLICYANKITNIDLSQNVLLTSLQIQGNGLSTLDISKNIALTNLNCSSNKLTALDVSKNLALSTLDCRTNQLNIVDISKNLALTNLSCSYNKLTTVDVSKNIALTSLFCFNNQLNALDLSTNVALTNLSCNDNKLTTLDVSKNVALTSLFCYNNQLNALDLTPNVALTILSCYNNQINTLDISKNVALSRLDCKNNLLTILNLKNGKNTLLTNSNISLSSNPNLSCIVVDDVAYANTNWATKKDSWAIFSPYDCATVTQIHDTKFEDKLIALGIDTDGKNGVVLNSSISAITSLDVSNSTIADMRGIEGFTALTTLNCSGNQLKKLDLSKNTSFTTLNCSNNPTLVCIQVANLATAASWTTTKDAIANFSLDCTVYTLIPDSKFEDKLIALGIDRDGKNGKVATESISTVTSLDVNTSGITNLSGIQDFVALTSLNCSRNQLTTLDVSKNVALSNLNSYQNRLITLDVSKNIALNYLFCSENQLTTLDISQNINLTELYCQKNLLSSLDVSKNVTLKEFYCSSNKLTTLDVSKNIALINFYCDSNQLTTLDVSKNIALVQFNCSSNNLTSLNLKNGKNTLLISSIISLVSNRDLRCIVVDNIAYANTNWATKKDATALFSSFDCSSITIIPDTKFEDKLIALGIDTDGKNGLVLNSSIAAITTLDVSNSTIADLKGIEGFTSLTTLNCSGNQLKKLDLSKNTTITTLNCSNNPTLICIQVANLTTAASWTTTKDVTASFSLDCTIYTLIPDTKFEEKLIALGIDRDGKNGKVATESIATITSLSLSSSSITNLTGIQDFISLVSLECFGNNITSLDVSKNISLKYLGCTATKLITLDLSKNVALTTFYCSNSQLTSLNIKNGKNTLITTNSINLVGNPNLKCILVDDETYANANWSTKKDATASFNSTDCTPYTLIPDGRFEDRLIVLGIDTDGKNGKVKTASIELLTDLSIINAGIKDLTGIQDFKALKTLICNANELTTIDLSKNIALTELYCNNNLITTLDVSKNINLSYLACFDNQIAVLDVSKNVLLKTLSARNNKIASLDLSKNVLLETLICKDNVLTTLNLKNGKNTLLSVLDTRNNSALSCILVDNVEYAVANFRQKDVTSDYSLNCTATVVYTTIPDVKFEEKLIALGIDNDGKNGKVKTTSIEYLKSINLQFSEIKDLTGIEDFKNLEVLDCAINSLTQLNVTKNLKLTELYCHFNTITSLDVSKNVLLTIIQANKNSLQKFDVSTNKVLKELNLRDNQLTTLNLKNGYNANASYYISRGNPNLTCIQVDSKTYADANWSSSKDTAASYSESCTNLSTSDIVFEKLSMYPNPTSGALFFDNVAIDKIRVYDALGKLMNVPFTSTGNSSTANLEQLPAGIYYIYLTSNDATTVKKVMVK
nr:T9SS type A sorting domain-containing protein [uncultured Flavobacterium sp.]